MGGKMICAQCGEMSRNKTKGYFCFLRHGQTEMNKKNQTIGSIDEPLNNLGCRQAKEVAEQFKESGETIDLIISSSLLRALETANIIGKELGVGVVTDDRLRERCVGVLEGQSEPPDSYKQFLRYDYVISGAEPLKDFEKRIVSLLADYKNKYLKKRILFITHGLVLLTVIKLIRGWDVQKIMNYTLPKTSESIGFATANKCKNCGSSFFIF